MTGIKKLKSGRYQARYFAGYDAKGKRTYPAKTFSLQSDAIKWRNARMREKDLGQQIEASQMTVAEYLEQWLNIKRDQVRTNTIRSYRTAVDAIIPHLGHIVLQKLKPEHIEGWQSEMLARGLKGSTARQNRTVFGTALNKAVRFHYIYTNPIKATDAPRRSKRNAQALDADQTRAFIVACAQERYGLSFRFMVEVGLRPEELFGLKWSALELEGIYGICHVREVAVRLPGGGWQFEEPKSERSFRSVAFSGPIVQELKGHRTIQLEQRIGAGTAWEDHGLVFCTMLGGPPNVSDHRKRFKGVLRVAGISEHYRLYDLRHTFATNSLLAEVDAKTISDDLGHSDVGFTLNTYAHVMQELKHRAAEKRQKLLSGKK